MKLLIDNIPVEVQGRKTILEAAREAGIAIPHLCDHSRLEPFGACRLCLVEVKGRRGFPPSCCTEAEEGLEVLTQTPHLQAIRREILELILSEHPFACLICSEKANCQDKKATIRKVSEVTGCILCSNDNRCELQDAVKAMGLEKVPYPARYRNFEVRRDDPFFDRNYNLCILCGRCVRVCSEVRGASAIALVSRGSEAVVGTALDRPLARSGCQFCGACVDVCPTGALVERAARPGAIPERWEETVCGFCGSGCRLTVGLKDGALITVRPSEESPANRGQACVRGRFLAREVIGAGRRILKPWVRKESELVEASWDEALDLAAEKLKTRAGASTGLVTSPQLALEDLYLAYRFGLDVLGTKNITGGSELSGLAAYEDFLEKNGLAANLNLPLEEIGRADAFLVCGEDPAYSQPMVWLQIHRAVREGAKLVVLNPFRTSADRESAVRLAPRPGHSAAVLALLARRILEGRKESGPKASSDFAAFKAAMPRSTASSGKETGVRDDELKEAARILGSARRALYLFGPSWARDDGANGLAALWNLARLTGARLVPEVSESNLRGERELRRGLGLGACSFDDIAGSRGRGKIKVLYLAGPAPRLDRSGLEVLIVQDSHWGPNAEQADVVFPAATFLESQGTFVNLEGRIQPFGPVFNPQGECRTDWEIFARLAERMGSKDLGYTECSRITLDLERAVGAFQDLSRARVPGASVFVKENRKEWSGPFIPLKRRPGRAARGAEHPLVLDLVYGLDYYRSLVLSAEVKGLRKLRDASWVVIHPRDAEALRLADGDPVVVESGDGAPLRGAAHLSEDVEPGSARAVWMVPGGTDLSWWGRTPTRVKIRKEES
jgi:formate dehydrogenase alpha subunit